MNDPWKHRKLDFPRPEDRLPVYADLYRFGGGDGPAPLVLHLQGAADRNDYVARRHTAPDFIAREVSRAWEHLSRPRLDLLVCPDPPDTREATSTTAMGLAWWETHYDDELRPALGGAPPTVGIVGHSAGGPSALYLGVVTEARAVATLGGAGMLGLLDLNARGERAVGPREFEKLFRGAVDDGWDGFDLRVYRNAQDNSDSPLEVQRRIRPPLRAEAMSAQPGGHSFRFYVDNGAAREAYAFVIGRIQAR